MWCFYVEEFYFNGDVGDRWVRDIMQVRYLYFVVFQCVVVFWYYDYYYFMIRFFKFSKEGVQFIKEFLCLCFVICCFVDFWIMVVVMQWKCVVECGITVVFIFFGNVQLVVKYSGIVINW